MYFDKQQSYNATKDDYTYPYLNDTEFSDEEVRALYFYTKFPPNGYKVDIPSPKYFKIKMKIDPCRNKGDNDLCCDGANDAVCEDNTSIISGTDIGVAWLMTGYVMTCSGAYTDIGTCGSYIEIHIPNVPQYIE